MTTLQVLKSNLMWPAGRRVDGFSTRKRRWICRDERGVKGMLRPRGSAGKRVSVFCASQGDGSSGSGNGEEPPESLFTKELRRRGMTPTSLLEESKRGTVEVDQDPKSKHNNGGVSMRSIVSTNFEQNLPDQRERSLSLNSEGLEGLIPRAKLLLTLGGTFFLAFRPLICATIAIFSALYFYFGTSFLHDGTDKHASLSQYVDPYALLEDGRITQTRIN